MHGSHRDTSHPERKPERVIMSFAHRGAGEGPRFGRVIWFGLTRTRRRKSSKQSGQGLVEFAISLLVFCLLLFGMVQFAIIGNAALAVSQLAYAGARYASINQSSDQSAIVSYMQSIAPSTINENSGADLSITVNPNTSPRQYGTPVTVSISYNLQNKLFLPTTFFGVSLPTTLPTISDTMMTE